MRIKTALFMLAALAVAVPALAQQPTPPSTKSDDFTDPSKAPSLDVWFYLQAMRRYDDPKQAVRRKAEAKAEQRRARMAARKWFGISNLRPTVSHVPWMGTYGPRWSGNSYDPLQWRGTGGPAVIITERESTRR